MNTLTVQLDDNVINLLQETAQQQARSIDELVQSILQKYLQRPPVEKRYSFIGIGHSGQNNLSSQTDEILAQAANRKEGWSLP